MMPRCAVLFSALAILLPLSLHASELRPADQPIEQVIDHYVDALTKADEVPAASQTGDATLLRRLTLDLAGRIPTAREARAYTESTSASKRVELVDRLLASPDFAFHHRNELEEILLPNRRNDGEFRKYLLWAAEQNRRWDDMFRDMLTGNEDDEYQKAALQFVRTRIRDVDDLTNATSVAFFGVNVSCAKCHDHPLVEDWKQDHFYGLQSFLSRTYVTKQNAVLEKPFGEVKYTTREGVEKQAHFMFLTGANVEVASLELSGDEKKKLEEAIRKAEREDNAPIPEPQGDSARGKLVDVALRDGDNHFFAQNIANRIWQRMLGRGLVDPVDQIHSGNPASHPELLEWLARDLVTHGYDLKRLIRGIALSQTYSRSSEWSSASEPPRPEYFALAPARPLTPRQYALSLLVASRNSTHWDQDALQQPDRWRQERESLENSSNGWAGNFEAPTDGFQIAVDEALLFSNNDRIQNDLLRDSGDRLVGQLKAIEDDQEAINTAFLVINSRQPTDEESSAIREYLAARADNRPEALKQAVWALLTGPELRFNH
ncbi:DUF1553 domain-containing protein [bacterium]|nr:DUF1553 domain-containing protein [bacterium]